MTSDTFLDLVKTALLAGVPELVADNVTVWHSGPSDPTEDIQRGIAKCHGVSALIHDLGGDSDPDDASAPVILARTAIELYVDTTKRNRTKTPTLRLPASIRDNIMTTLHANQTLLDGRHYHMEPRIKGYQPLADPDYVCYRVTLLSSIYLL